MQQCDCFHPQMDLSLLNVSKFHFKDRQRPCNLVDGGNNGKKKYVADFCCMVNNLLPA